MADISDNTQTTDSTITVSPPDQQSAGNDPTAIQSPQESSVLPQMPTEPPPIPPEIPTIEQSSSPPLVATENTAPDAIIVPPNQEEKQIKTPPTTQQTPPPSNLYFRRKKSTKGFILAMVLLLLITLPLAVFYVSQQKPQNDVRSRAFSLVYPYCNGPNDIIVSDSYKCVLQYHGTYNEEYDVRCCTIGHSPNGNTSCPLPIKDCTNNPNGPLPVCMGTTWSCAKVVVTPTPTTISTTLPAGGNWYCGGGHGIPPPNGTECDSTSGVKGTFQGVCAVYHCPNGCASDGKCGETSPGFTLTFANCDSASLAPGECGQIDTVAGQDPGWYCEPKSPYCDVKALNCNCKVKNTPTPTKGITNTPIPTQEITDTPTPTSAPQCPSIQIFKGDQLITDYSTIMPGDSISILVGPTASQISIDGTTFKDLTTKNSDGTLWQDDETVPTDRTSFSVEVK